MISAIMLSAMLIGSSHPVINNICESIYYSKNISSENILSSKDANTDLYVYPSWADISDKKTGYKILADEISITKEIKGMHQHLIKGTHQYLICHIIPIIILNENLAHKYKDKDGHYKINLREGRILIIEGKAFGASLPGEKRFNKSCSENGALARCVAFLVWAPKKEMLAKGFFRFILLHNKNNN